MTIRANSALLTVLATLVVVAVDVDAQVRRPFVAAGSRPLRFTITVNGGFQGRNFDFTDRFEFERFVETARLGSDYSVESGPFFDGGAAYQFWKGLGVAVAVSHLTQNGSVRVDASIPHPFFDAQPREVSGEPGGMTRTETGVHLQATYTVDPRGPLSLVLSAGPSIVRTKQELVTGVRYSEAYPFDSATFTGAETRRVSGSGTGFNAGVDIIWSVTRRFGVGGIVRFSRASIDLGAPDDRTVTVDAGGLQAAGGVRFRF